MQIDLRKIFEPVPFLSVLTFIERMNFEPNIDLKFAVSWRILIRKIVAKINDGCHSFIVTIGKQAFF